MVRLSLQYQDLARQTRQLSWLDWLQANVPKLEPAVESLRADDIKPDPIIDVGEHIPGRRVVFFRDPENEYYRVDRRLSIRGVSRFNVSVR